MNDWTRRDATDLGLRFAGAIPSRPHPFTPSPLHPFTPSPPHPYPAVVGFTAPTLTYDKMRQIQSFAESLDLQIATVADPVFRASWNAWFEHAWLPFFDKYAGSDPSTLAKIRATFSSDELAAQVESYRRQIESFAIDYEKQKIATGQAVTPVPGSAPESATPTAAQQALTVRNTGLPWWFWVGSTVALAGIGYLVYRRFSGSSDKSSSARDASPTSYDRVVYLPAPPALPAAPATPPEPATFRDYIERGPTGDGPTMPILPPERGWL